MYRTYQLVQDKTNAWLVKKEGMLVHKCQRTIQDGMITKSCKCSLLGRYLICLGFELGHSGKAMLEFLQAFYLQPNLRMPFEAFVYWV